MQHGCGGDDAKSFAHDLASCYVKYVQGKGLAVELLATEQGHVVLQVCGRGAGRLLAAEAGKHVVQRVPENDRRGRAQTSVVAVAVLPIPPVQQTVAVNPKDLEIICQVGSGPGGQHRNRSATTVRVKHKPTGITAKIDSRSQAQNKRDAIAIVTAKVNERANRGVSESYDRQRRDAVDGSRGGKLRTYNYMRQQVLDHRTGKAAELTQVLKKGGLDLLR